MSSSTKTQSNHNALAFATGFIVLLLCASLAIAVELFLRIAAPVDDPVQFPDAFSFHKFLPPWNAWRYESWTPRKEPPYSFRFHTGKLNGIRSTETDVSVNSFGFLYDESKQFRKSRDEIRIAIIGGSTVEGAALPEASRISSVLERYVQTRLDDRTVTVMNLGVSAQDSRQHISTLAHHAVELDVDFAVFIIGANDMHQFGGYASWIADAILRVDFSPPSLKKWAVTRTQIGRRLYLAREAAARTGERRTQDVHKTQDLPFFDYWRRRRKELPVLPFQPNLKPNLRQEYVRNIRTLNSIATAHGIQPIFLTQPSLWKNDTSVEEEDAMWMAAFMHAKKPYRLTSGTAASMLAELNGILLSECASSKFWCVDLAVHIPPEFDFFYDDMHYNEHGAEAVGKVIGEKIVSKAMMRQMIEAPSPHPRN